MKNLTNLIFQRSSYLILGITLLAFGMYTWGVWKNLPYIPEVGEKHYWVGRAVTMAATGSANPGWFGHPGSTTLYPMAAAFRLVYGENAQVAFDAHPTRFYLAGWLLGILYGTLSIPVIYLIGKKVLGETAGAIGALLFIFYSVAVSHFQIVRTDSAAVFFGVLSLWMILKVAEVPSWRNQALAGICIGMGIASRYFMLILVPVLFALDAWLIITQKDKKKNFLAAGVGLLVIPAVFAAVTPYFFLDFNAALENLRLEARTTHVGADGLTPLGNLWWYLSKAIPENITWLQYLFAVLGLGLLVKKKGVPAFLLVGYGTIFLTAISLSALHWSRWVIPILPILALLAGFGLERGTYIIKNKTYRHLALGLGLALLLASPIQDTVMHNYRESHTSTRILAREWIVNTIPPGSTILQEWYSAPLDGLEYDAREVFSLAEDQTLESYQGDGIDYLVASSAIYQRYFNEPDRYPEEVSFYNRLFAEGALLQELLHTDWQGGPTIRIYELDESVLP